MIRIGFRNSGAVEVVAVVVVINVVVLTVVVVVAVVVPPIWRWPAVACNVSTTQ